MIGDRLERKPVGPQPRLRCVVCIPAKDEADWIGACIDALAAQCARSGHRLDRDMFRVLLFVNNTRDDTAARARRHAAAGALNLDIVEAVLPPSQANAGTVRRLIMDEGAACLARAGVADGIILTTDADTCVPPDWISRNLAVIDGGVDAVAGTLALDPADEAALPSALKWRGALEAAYERTLCELEARLDPRPFDPWPRHRTASGASIALRASAYRAIGGLPRCALGEDRALIDTLARHDFKVRHPPEIVVVTSGRLVGRADGGVADTIRLRIAHPETPCDPFLEPVGVAALRFAWRGAMRRTHISAGPTPRVWRHLLGLDAGTTARIAAAPHAGEAIEIGEASSRRLRRRPLVPRALARHIFCGRALVWILRRRSAPVVPHADRAVVETMAIEPVAGAVPVEAG